MRGCDGELDLEIDCSRLERVAGSRETVWWCGNLAESEAVRHGC